jgi:DNA invertase Pin-like site-specific DNA recombinase
LEIPKMTQKTFLAYIRKSVVEGETDSPARQRAAIERRVLAAYPDARIEWYEDLDISGKSESNRPGWQRLLADLKSKGGAGVAVESYDRSHRNVKEFLSFYDDALAPVGRTLISATQNLDLATADGRLMATVMMGFAEAEARKASERMTAHLGHLRAAEGRHHGSIPFGCDRDPQTKHLIPSQTAYLYNATTGEAVPDSTPVGELAEPPPGFQRRYYHDALRILYETYATGQQSLTDAAISLNAAGWRAWQRDYRTPMEFGGNTTRSIIRHWPIYAGRLPVETGQKVGSRKTPPQLVDGGHPPILPVELCEAVGAALAVRIRQGGPRGKTRLYILGGIVFCGVCGCKLSGQTIQDRQYYRHVNIKRACSEIIAKADGIHREILELVRKILASRELLDETAAELRRLAAEMAAGEDGEKFRQKEAELERLIDLRTDGLITKEQFVQRQAKIQAELDKLRPSFHGQSLAVIEDIISNLEDLSGRIEEADLNLQKEVIRGLFKRIEVRNRRVSRVVPQEWCAVLLDQVLKDINARLLRGPE